MLLSSQSAHIPACEMILEAGWQPERFYTQLLALMDETSALLCRYYADPAALESWEKADQSPITAADQAAHELLRSGLTGIAPGIPVLSEESSAAEIDQRLSWDAVWIVDPLDGTREFLDRTGQFTCNVALVWGGRPVLGVISVPVRQQHYIGVPGAGAERIDTLGATTGQPMKTRALDTDRAMTMLASVRHSSAKVAAAMARLEPVTGRVRRANAGSAVKFCELVEGRADVYPRTSPCYEWDVAAGDALVTAAGGCVCSYDGQPLHYNRRSTLLAEPFIAAGDPQVDFVARLALPEGAPGLSPEGLRS